MGASPLPLSQPSAGTGEGLGMGACPLPLSRRDGGRAGDGGLPPSPVPVSPGFQPSAWSQGQAGEGLKTKGFVAGEPLHSTPFRQDGLAEKTCPWEGKAPTRPTATLPRRLRQGEPPPFPCPAGTGEGLGMGASSLPLSRRDGGRVGDGGLPLPLSRRDGGRAGDSPFPFHILRTLTF
jgi:hypothetical protein